MKYLYYNPYETASKVRIKSKCFNIDVEYSDYDSDGKPIYIDSLFEIAKLDCFDDVQIYLTNHEQAYWKSKKKDLEGTRITGWVSLKQYRNGGGYLEDQYLLKVV